MGSTTSDAARGLVVGALWILLVTSGCGGGRAGTVATSKDRCQSGRQEELRAIPREDEYLHAGYLPVGVAQRTGDEHDPYRTHSTISYSSGTPTGPAIELLRRFNHDPPGRYLLTSGPGAVTVPTTVHGKPGVRLSVDTDAVKLTNIAWKERPEITIMMLGHNVGQDEAHRIAEGVAYDPGRLGPASTDCHQLPPGTVSRESVVARWQGTPGAERVSTKLVRVADLVQAAPELADCLSSPCEPGLVRWVVLVEGRDLGPSRQMPSLDLSTTEPPHRTWSLHAVDAASGESRGASGTGSGPPPASFKSLQDVAP